MTVRPAARVIVVYCHSPYIFSFTTGRTVPAFPELRVLIRGHRQSAGTDGDFCARQIRAALPNRLGWLAAVDGRIISSIAPPGHSLLPSPTTGAETLDKIRASPTDSRDLCRACAVMKTANSRQLEQFAMRRTRV